jgi:hypothetical protein
MTTTNYSEIAEAHRQSLVELGWKVGPLQDDGFEVEGCVSTLGSVVKPHRRQFGADGSMLVTRHATSSRGRRR